MTSIVAMGDNVVDCYISTGQMYPGGNCLNVSVFARRFGAETAYVGAIGKDAAGSVIQAALQQEGVDASRLRVLVGETGYCVIGHQNSDRIFLRYDLGVSRFVPAPDDLAFVAKFDAVHVGQSSGLDAAIADIAGAAPLSYDFSTRHDPAHIAAIAPLCLLASASAGALSPDAAIALARALLDAGAQWALVTRGKEGALLGHGDTIYRAQAAEGAALDTLGAGDTTIARVLCGLLRVEPAQQVLEAAMAAAAETCSYYGAVGHGAAIALADPVPEIGARQEA